jgi:hypothetical protein
MNHPRGCHEHASDQAINQALKKLSQRCEFVANRRPCYTRAQFTGGKNSHEWQRLAWREWVGNGTTVKKIMPKTR